MAKRMWDGIKWVVVIVVKGVTYVPLKITGKLSKTKWNLWDKWKTRLNNWKRGGKKSSYIKNMNDFFYL